MDTVQSRGGGGFILLMFGGVLACLFAWMIAKPVTDVHIVSYDLAQPTAIQQLDTCAGTRAESDGITVEYQAHAESHGIEANWTRDCFGRYGTVMFFKWPFDDRYARLCMDDEGYIGAQFLKNIGERLYIEVSSYVPHLRDVSLSGVKDWLLSQGWSVFNGPLP